MAKPNNVSPPPPESGQDYQELDRFPPRRGNPKEARRTAVILASSIVILVTGIGLRATVFKPRFLAPPVPESETMNDTGPSETTQVPSSFTDGPIPLHDRRKVAKTRPSISKQDASPDPAASPDTGLAVVAPSTIAAPTSTMPGMTAPPTSGTSASTGTAGQTGKDPYTTYSEPPVVPSLAQTGGVYKPSYAPPPLPTSGISRGVSGGINSGVTPGSVGGTATGVPIGGLNNTTGSGSATGSTYGNYGSGSGSTTTGTGTTTGSTTPPRF